MRKGKTESGFNFKIDETVVDDMELVEELAEADKDISRFPQVLTKVLGEEQKKKLYDHLRDENGRVTISATVKEFEEIMTLAGEETKNS